MPKLRKRKDYSFEEVSEGLDAVESVERIDKDLAKTPEKTKRRIRVKSVKDLGKSIKKKAPAKKKKLTRRDRLEAQTNKMASDLLKERTEVERLKSEKKIRRRIKRMK